ncbi:MAG: hydroxyacid dehydrogenase [Thermoanaerobaculia bacterium]|jgi:D-3-phosphoglycerate dehydrogenase|nr:hydroxyacid dehydrogenase [Thermoanaerobaculia bacterium]
MRVLVADKFEETGLEGLRSLGCEVYYEPKLEGEALGWRLRDTAAEVLVVRSTKVTAAEMDQARNLSLVVRAGAGVNTIDLPAASARAISVSNCPGKNAVAVAELAWGLILALDRRIAEQTADLKAGLWNKAEYGRARGLAGRTLGIAGFGAIGREVAARGRAFDMEVVAWSPSLSAERAAEAGVVRVASLRELASRSDVVSVHLALTKETRGVLGGAFFDAMRPGALFVNTSRGETVNAAALKEAIATKGIRAGLDVFEREPSGGTGAFEDEVGRLPGVVGTHHVGASTEQAQNAIAAEVVRIVAAFKASGEVPNAVNLCGRSPARWLLTVRHRDRVGVLAHVFGALREAGINVQQTENVVFDGAEAASARIQLDSEPTRSLLARVAEGCRDILSITLNPL